MITGVALHDGQKSCGCIVRSAGGLSKTREYQATKGSKRRAMVRAARIGRIAHADILKLYAAQRGCCAICRQRTSLNRMHRDHIVPLVSGGEHSIYNIQLLCRPCNLAKGPKDPIKFAQQRGFLI